MATGFFIGVLIASIIVIVSTVCDWRKMEYYEIPLAGIVISVCALIGKALA